jgi:hypothetical protein
MLISRISAGLNLPDAVIVSMIALSFYLPCVKLRPLPQPHLRKHTYTHTYPRTQRATQLKSVLACA